MARDTTHYTYWAYQERERKEQLQQLDSQKKQDITVMKKMHEKVVPCTPQSRPSCEIEFPHPTARAVLEPYPSPNPKCCGATTPPMTFPNLVQPLPKP